MSVSTWARNQIRTRTSVELRGLIWRAAVRRGLRPRGLDALEAWIAGFLHASPAERVGYIQHAHVPVHAIVYAGGLRQAVKLCWLPGWDRFIPAFADGIFVPTINTVINNLFVIGQFTGALSEMLAKHDTETWGGMTPDDSVPVEASQKFNIYEPQPGIDFNQAFTLPDGSPRPERGPMTQAAVDALFRSQGRGPRGEVLNSKGEPIKHDADGNPIVIGPPVDWFNVVGVNRDDQEADQEVQSTK